MREAAGEKLKMLRKKKKKTQEEVAADLGISASSWSMYEQGERVPRDELKIRIAAYFGKSVAYIFF